MQNEFVLRIIPHDEVMALRSENSRLTVECEILRAQRDEAQHKYASECHINMALQDENKELKKQLHEWRMICNV